MLNDICKKRNAKTFSISYENPTGEKGNGARAECVSGNHPARDLGKGWKVSPSVIIPAHTTFNLADIKGEGAIKHIWMTAKIKHARDFVIRIYWDGNETPSVEAPYSDFFANADNNEYHQISSLAVCVNACRAMNCYWEMPYRKGFRITIENISNSDGELFYQVDCENRRVGDDELYFHAQFRRSNPLPYKECHTLLDNIHGSGQYVGTYIYWGSNNNGWWGEGEIKFYLDGDDEYPTVCGTGTEDYFCGAWCFEDGQYHEFTSPYTGFSICKTDELWASQRRFNLYRWHITDPIYFDEDIRVTIQALGWRSDHRFLPLMDDISSVSYWYSDTLDDVYPTLPGYDELEII